MVTDSTCNARQKIQQQIRIEIDQQRQGAPILGNDFRTREPSSPGGNGVGQHDIGSAPVLGAQIRAIDSSCTSLSGADDCNDLAKTVDLAEIMR